MSLSILAADQNLLSRLSPVLTSSSPPPAPVVTSATPVAAAAASSSTSGSPQKGMPGRNSAGGGTAIDAPATLPDFSTPAAGSAAVGEQQAARAERSVWNATLLERIARPADDSDALTPAEAAADSRKAQKTAA